MTFIFFENFLKPGIYFIFISLVAFLIIVLSFYLSDSNPYVEKVSAYECGFEPDNDARNLFEIRFYIVAMLFLIFDLEAIFFFPWCVSFGMLDFNGFIGIIDFLLELLVGYIYAWQIGAFDWV